MTSPGARVYLDVCALCRPLDDQRAIRIRLETEAVNLILEGERSGILQLISSPAHRIEIEAIRDSEKRSQLLALLDVLAFSPHFNFATCRALAEELMDKGLGLPIRLISHLQLGLPLPSLPWMTTCSSIATSSLQGYGVVDRWNFV